MSRSDLPLAPRLRADVIATEHGVALLGWDARRWHLDPLPTPVFDALQGCTGRRLLDALLADLSPADGDLFVELLTQVQGCGLLQPQPQPRRVALVGSGRLARAIAEHLVAHRVALDLVDPDPCDERLYPDAPECTGAQALQAWLAERGADPTTLRTSGHWQDLAWRRRPELVVVAPATVTVDRAVTDHLVRHQVRHLVVAAHRDHAVVGPLVVPGETACQCCVDLAQTTDDPDAAAVIAHRSRQPAVPDAWLVAWAAGQAVMAVAAVAAGEPPRLPIWVARPNQVVAQHWPQQPGCSCSLLAAARLPVA